MNNVIHICAEYGSRVGRWTELYWIGVKHGISIGLRDLKDLIFVYSFCTFKLISLQKIYLQIINIVLKIMNNTEVCCFDLVGLSFNIVDVHWFIVTKAKENSIQLSNFRVFPFVLLDINNTQSIT